MAKLEIVSFLEGVPNFLRFLISLGLGVNRLVLQDNNYVLTNKVLFKYYVITLGEGGSSQSIKIDYNL